METTQLDSSILIHSKEFIIKWKELVKEVFNYKEEDNLLKIPNLIYGHSFSYLPFIDYCDLDINQTIEISKKFYDKRYLLRTVDFKKKIFEFYEPVTMRIDIANKTEDEIWKQSLNDKCRNQIRKSIKYNLSHEIGNSVKFINEFYYLYDLTMHRNGMPALPLIFFQKLSMYFNIKFRITYLNKEPISALIEINDNNLYFVPWAASNIKYNKYNPNNYIYWHSICSAIKENAKVYDFGRSPYKGKTFKFKSQWGAKPFAIKFISNKKNINLYSKYLYVQKIWKILPKKICNRLSNLIIRKLLNY